MIGEAMVLRPEPGNTQTARRLVAAGFVARQRPLFAVRPLPWTAPDPAGHDALLLTSANAIRHAGAELALLQRLPVVAVGEATAAAARDAGLTVALTGARDAGAAAELAHGHGLTRLLHLAGREHKAVRGVEVIAVYTSDPLPVAPGELTGGSARTALLHSARAARRFAALLDRDGANRSEWALAALSPAVAGAAGQGWARVLVAADPTDAALVKVLGAG